MEELGVGALQVEVIGVVQAGAPALNSENVGSKPRPLCRESKLRALRIAEQIEKHEEISGLID